MPATLHMCIPLQCCCIVHLDKKISVHISQETRNATFVSPHLPHICLLCAVSQLKEGLISNSGRKVYNYNGETPKYNFISSAEWCLNWPENEDLGEHSLGENVFHGNLVCLVSN